MEDLRRHARPEGLGEDNGVCCPSEPPKTTLKDAQDYKVFLASAQLEMSRRLYANPNVEMKEEDIVPDKEFLATTEVPRADEKECCTVIEDFNVAEDLLQENVQGSVEENEQETVEENGQETVEENDQEPVMEAHQEPVKENHQEPVEEDPLFEEPLVDPLMNKFQIEMAFFEALSTDAQKRFCEYLMFCWPPSHIISP
ncbi:hypothetical protein CEUSTIGMA_g8236.t1 [Chlamydomonas eustigma]|uniref:Uncharacterized protein n=1 Tax=Chlamydomonas eustigma TaxID=1157962 RepID=A0A250XDG0_9CHLO|nr:hypothetical protein CEUSTIGMA_g8236.t1 [Chlamydomonas eustigma]|eukprot:GAX80800.1 hypothetical protein CEUSTIGMA_g8236.t1 [Chlamydomonas eustigma]